MLCAAFSLYVDSTVYLEVSWATCPLRLLARNCLDNKFGCHFGIHLAFILISILVDSFVHFVKPELQ